MVPLFVFFFTSKTLFSINPVSLAFYHFYDLVMCGFLSVFHEIVLLIVLSTGIYFLTLRLCAQTCERHLLYAIYTFL